MLALLRDRLKTQTGLVSVGLSLAVIAAAGAFLFGQGATSQALRLLPGGMWLLNHATGTATHVNGATGVKDGEWAIRLDPGRSAQQVIDVNGSMVALDDEGNAHLISAATGPQNQVSTALGSGYQLFVGESTVYATQMPAGDVQARAGVEGGLAALGEVLNVGGPISSGAVGSGDVLVTTVPEDGAVVTVDRTEPSSSREFTPNSLAKVAVVRGTPVLADLTAGVVRTLSGPAREVRFDPAGVDAQSVFSGCDKCDSLVIGKAKTVIAVDLLAETVKEVALPLAGDVRVEQAVVRGGDVFVKGSDGLAHQVDVATSSVKRIGGDAKFTDLHAVGDNVFFNDANGATALTINAGGKENPVTKYTTESTEAARAEASQGPAPTSAGAPKNNKPKKTKNVPTPGPTAEPAREPNDAGTGGGADNNRDGPGSPPAAQDPTATPAPSESPPAAPAQPRAPRLAASAGSRGQIDVTLSWDSSLANGATIGGFTVVLGGARKSFSPADLAGGSVRMTFGGLADSSNYTATATVRTEAGLTASASDSARTVAAPPPPRPTSWEGSFEPYSAGVPCSLVRSGPRLDAGQIDCYRKGVRATVRCWAPGDEAHGTSVWYRLESGYTHADGFVIDGYARNSRPNDMPNC